MQAKILGLCALFAVACTERRPPREGDDHVQPSRVATPTAATPPVDEAEESVHADTTPPGLAPLQGEWMQKLEDEASGAAIDFASPPLGATSPRPVVVVLHGMDARPEWVCNDFRATFGAWPVIVCPRGDARSPANYSWGSTNGIRRAIERAVARAEQRWPGYLHAEGRVLVGYSQSSSMAPALLASSESPPFAAAYFLEGFTKKIAAYAPRMAKRGLGRAMFVATQPGNRAPAEASAKALGRAGVMSSAEYTGSLGHWFTPKTVPALRKTIPALVGELPGWAEYPGPPEK